MRLTHWYGWTNLVITNPTLKSIARHIPHGVLPVGRMFYVRIGTTVAINIQLWRSQS